LSVGVSRPIELISLVRPDGTTAADPREWTNVLAEVPLFASLNGRHRRKVAEAARIRRFHDGMVLMRAGEQGDALHVILDGEVLVRRRGQPALRLGIGSFVGELALLDNGPRTATVTANGPVIALTITRARFRKLLVSEPTMTVAIAEELASRLRTAQAAS
jgi:CRP/FNR family transcriptional regulator, cyclic AMP receptor protein